MKYLKLIALIAPLLAASSSSFARPVDLGFATSATPYERFMQPVKHVLSRLNGRESDFDRVRRLLKVGRSFRYSYSEPYVAAPPDRTAALRAGDCKAKSLWLIDQLDDQFVRYVIGKAHINSPLSHAWVMWNDGSFWWILDPTNRREPIRADRVSSGEYVALYSYGKDGARLHRRIGALTSSPTSHGGREVVADVSSRSKTWRASLRAR